jgi:thiamine-phosphate pyrophosphorylase
MGAGLRLITITSREVVPDDELLARVGALAPLGQGALVQLREPGLHARDLLARARWLREATTRAGILLAVNDRIDVALACGADGVHLGGGSVSIAEARSLLPAGALVTASAHSLEELRARSDADALLLSPLFHSPGKGAPLGVAMLTRARALLDELGSSAALVALGGVTASTVASCLDAGAHAVAAIRADLGQAVLLAAPRDGGWHKG